MRLALIRQRYTPFGGAERFVESALEALLERNVAITLYTRSWPETRLKLIEPHIVDPFYIGSLWRDIGFARAVSREVGRAKLDLVQSHERLLCCDVYRAGDGVHAVWLEERMRGASWVRRATVRGNLWHQRVLAMERALYASPLLQAVICNSEMVKSEIVERFPISPDKLHVIYNAVDSEAFGPHLREGRKALLEALRIDPQALVYLFVGSGFERKNLASVIVALARQPQGTHLLVVGRDKDIDDYRALARRHGVADRVIFAGPQTDPKPYFGAADVFVLPSIYDPLPNAALEAMACGLPVICSTKTGVAELLARHDAGLACPARDADGLAAHMRAMADPQLRARLGANGRRAASELAPEAMTLKLVLLYKTLLEASAERQRADAARRSSGRRAEA